MVDRTKVEVKLDFPISLEDILSVSVNTNNFKLVFDFILDILRKHENVMRDIKNITNSEGLSSEISKIKEMLAAQQQDIDEMKKISTEQNTKIQSIDDKLNDGFKRHDISLEDIYQRLDQHQEQLNNQVRQIDTLRIEVEDEAKRISENEIKMKEIQNKTEKNVSDINDHELRLRVLEQNIDDIINGIRNGSLSNNKKSSEANDESKRFSDQSRTNISNDITREVRDLNIKLRELESKLKSVDEKSEDAKIIADRADQRTAFHDSKITELEESIRKLEHLYKRFDSNGQSVSDELDSLKKLFRQFEETLRQKVDVEDFDQLKSMLQNQGGSAGGHPQPSNSGGSISTKDLNLLRELGKRYDDLREKLESLSGVNPQLIDDILSRISKLEETIIKKADKSDLDELKSLLSKLKSDIERHERSIRSLEERPISFGASGEDIGASGADSSKINSLSRRIAVIEEQLRLLVLPEGIDLIHMWNLLQRATEDIKELKEKFEKMYKEFWTKIKELNDLFSGQASQEDLKNLEKSLQEKVIAVCDAMGKKFADKTDTKKALKYLERLIREIYESPGKERRDGEDAMLAKKPLGGWSCASCEKQLEKLAGKVANYQPWNKMPHRDPADRIARAGPGFSRMLATVNPEMLSNRTRTSHYHAQSPINSHFEEDMPGNNSDMVNLPPVRGGERPTSSS
ncbi:unnamed protein product [Blepharisma stoltei]|uniref:Uncharacterized protein n=1 Tax=Blepharisma stoltei TaxID=1481888 RepID=A0AAU9JJ72_9CILI|nr:unnamed protein product [Blepharisma stoltei]